MTAEHVDVLIVGAGLSGIGAGCHLQAECPDKSFTILEARGATGGTWDLFRYPGIRSDSDMFTLGYAFRPWDDAKAIADGPSILEYVRETAREHRIEDKIRLNHRAVRAEWSSEDARWTVDVARTDTGETVQLTCEFLYMCTGYYRYDEGFTPELPGLKRFKGTLIHPQHWPEDLDYRGRRVVVIGSGATAVTLVPAMAEDAAHVTMLQRSPSYILSLPGTDPLADVLRRVLPAKVAYPLLRWKNVGLQSFFFNLSRKAPNVAKAILRRGVQRHVGNAVPLDPHFKPTYQPWDQRLCLVPDGDLFDALKSRKASIVTDRIKTFTKNGIELESGNVLEADIVVTATGLNLLALGGTEFVVDGREIALGDTVAYKGMMLSGVPNMAFATGYTNASWTLKADLVSQYVCRLINHLDELGMRQVTPRAPDPSEPRHPFIDLMSGYVLRSLDKFPKQGDRMPWRLHQNYVKDVKMLRRGPIEDEGVEFSNPPVVRTAEPAKLAA